MARIASKADRNKEFVRRVAESLYSEPLECENPGTAYESWAGFALARRVQRIVFDFGPDPLKINPVVVASLIRGAVGDYCSDWDTDLLLEYFVEAWAKIVIPEGLDPVEYAARRANRNCPDPPGEYTSPAQRKFAGQLWGILCTLPEREGVVFLSVRRAAEELGTDKDRAHLVLKALQRNGVILATEKGRMGRASRYRILIRPSTDR